MHPVLHYKLKTINSQAFWQQRVPGVYVAQTHLSLADFDVLSMIDSLANWILWSLYTTYSPVKISYARDKIKRVYKYITFMHNP